MVLHTIPAESKVAVPNPAEETQTLPAESPTLAGELPIPSKRSFSPALIPQLVTVAEIIKREHLRRLQAKKRPMLHGVYQYNEAECLEDLDLGAAVGRSIDLVAALSGNKKYVVVIWCSPVWCG